jgi:hypothetical protein
MKSLRLRPGVHYAPVEDGVYFSSARATFVMRGPARLFRVVDICLPLLEDGADLDDLVAALGTPAARPVVTRLAEALDSRGLVLHLDQLPVPEPAPAERERFPETLAYLETYRDDPYADFRRIRKARVLLAGPADALGPAARGVVRAGAGQVMIATDEPERLAGLASRHPEVRLLLHDEGTPQSLISTARPHAAVIFSEDSFPFEAVHRLPVDCVVVPVRLGKDVAVVGPATERADNGRRVEALWDRAARWCRLDGDDLLVRPSGDLLAGALAGQATIDALIGRNPGRIHVVHGPDLSSDSITPALTAAFAYDPPTEFRGGVACPAAERPAIWTASVSGRWTGLFGVKVPGDLPQMPLALTFAEGRTQFFEGRALGFGPDQQASTSEAGLDALRQHCATLERTNPGPWPGPSAVAAAAVDRSRWLLDGALRLLARVPAEDHPVDWPGLDDVEARRMGRAMEEHELTPIRLCRRQVPGFGWTLVSVTDRRSGALLGGGWGPTPAVASLAALSAAMATQQVRRTVDPGYEAGGAEPGFLAHLHEPYVDDLATQVGVWLHAGSRRLRGRRLARDPVAGPLAAWCGTVWLDD